MAKSDEQAVAGDPPVAPPVGGLFGISALGWYMSGQCLWFIAAGIQFVAFPGVVAILLNETPARVGIAQAAMMLPALIFMLPGGALADRQENRALLVRLQAFATLVPLFMAILIFQDAYSYASALFYALLIGTITAFAVPARDGFLMSIVERERAQQAIAIALALQFIGMLLGMIYAGLPVWGGVAGLFLVQSAIFFIGMMATAQVRARSQPVADAGQRNRWREIVDGFAVARRTESVMPVLVAMMGIGLFYVGPFMVLLSLLVRDIHGGGIQEIGYINIAFWSGTILVTLMLLRIGRIERSGRLLFLGICGGLTILLALSLPVSFWVTCLFCFLWGCGAGISMTMSRTIIQENAPEPYRARLMSMYNLGFMGGGPVGALAVGFLAQYTGLHQAFYYPAAGMALLLLVLLARGRLWQIRARPLYAGEGI